ncbi:MAG: DUF6687 family protein [Rubrivivax sp.]
MPARLYISGSRHPRPASTRTLYADGSHDPLYREGVDLELSHWRPNVTPAVYKDDTSTGVAWRYLDAGAPGGYDLVVNDHVDTDGLLASLVLLQPQACAPHRALLLQVAAMGDFAAWGDEPAQRFYQHLAHERVRLHAAGVDPLERAWALHQVAVELMARPPQRDDDGLLALRRAEAHIDAGRIVRRELAPRLVHYEVPADLAPPGLDLTPDQPRIDQPLHPAAVCPPAARARRDAERLQIVSIARAGGLWTHELCWPSYAWADTVNLWQPPGMQSTGGENEYRFELPALAQAAQELQRVETASQGRWVLAQLLDVFNAVPGRHFPVVLSFMDGDAPAASELAPAQVRDILRPALA